MGYILAAGIGPLGEGSSGTLTMQQPFLPEHRGPVAVDDERGPPLVYSAPAQSDVLDVRYLLTSLLWGSWLIALFAAIGLYNGVQSVQAFTPTYEATMVIAAGTTAGGAQSQSDIGALGQRFGLDLGAVAQASSSASAFDHLKLALNSPTIMTQLDAERDLLGQVFPNDRPGNAPSARPTGWRFELGQSVRSMLGLPTWTPSAPQTPGDHLAARADVSAISDTPFTRVSTRHSDPATALRLLSVTYFAADEYVRQHGLAQSLGRKQYLEQQLQRTASLEHRATFTGLLLQEERRLMLARSDLPYAAEIVEPPHVSTRPSRPEVTKLVGVPVAGWTLAAVFLVLAFALLRNRRHA